MSNKKRICVIPAYEPDHRLISLVEEAVGAGLDVMVVDDGSGAAYRDIFRSASEHARVVSYEDNGGKGHAMKAAFKQICDELSQETVAGPGAGYESCSIVIVDSDGQHRVSDAIRLLEEAEANTGTLILGSRKQSKDSPLRSRFGNGVTRTVFRLASGVRIYDTQTGMRAFSGELLQEMLSVPGERYEYEMNMLMQFAEKRIPMKEVEIETIYFDNNSGSHFHTFKDSWRIYKEIFKFSGSSILAFLVDYALYSLFNLLSSGRAVLFCNIGARIISATLNFYTNRKFVFGDKGPLGPAALKYFLLAAGILVCNTGLLYVFTRGPHINIYLAKLMTEIILFFASYIIQKRAVFRRAK